MSRKKKRAVVDHNKISSILGSEVVGPLPVGHGQIDSLANARKPRPINIWYLYRCLGRCRMASRRGASAKRCHICRGPLQRMETAKGCDPGKCEPAPHLGRVVDEEQPQ